MKRTIILILFSQLYLSCLAPGTGYRDYEPTPEPKFSCSFNLLDGECSYNVEFNGSVLCSMGKCSSGDCITGKGVLTYPSGTTLETNFKNGEMDKVISLKECGSNLHFVGILGTNSSKGVHTYTNGEVFEGLIANGMKQGKGIFTDSKGNSYEGNWKNDIREGKFTIKDKESGTKKTVTYINGRDDEQREKDRLYAIELKARREAELSDMRNRASTNQMWHNRFHACDVFSVHDHCDSRVPIIFKYSQTTGGARGCGKSFESERIYFQCQIKGSQRTALHDTAITIFTDQNGNCSPRWSDLCN